MCGIVGYITTNIENYENARRGFLKYALMLDTLRGPDSTGVITVSKKFTVNRYKTISSGFRMATSPQFEKNVPNGWCSIGHNRAATVGDITVDNAHPFKFGKVSLVHNGTLRNDGRNLPGYDKKLEVDSMQVAKALSEAPSKEAYKILEQIDGDFALVWVDERDRTINMAKNRGRPLHLGFNWDRSFMVFMSDDEHLQVLSKAFNHTTASIPTIYALDSFQHLKWKRGNLRPEVVEFRPFALAQGTGMVTTHTPKSSESGQTHTGNQNTSKGSRTKREQAAQRRADRKWKKWQENQDESTTERPVNGSLSLINRQISQYDGWVPKNNTAGMLEALESFFSCQPSNLTSFKPEDFYELTDNLYHVVGSVRADGWGGCDWEGTINFVNKMQVDAYGDGLWLVRPVGLTRNRSIPGCPALLCDLVHCDYQKYEKSLQDKKEGISKEIVKDPAGRLITKAKLEKMMESGCINCQTPLNVEDAYSYGMVNNDQDIVCEDCKWEKQWPIIQ